MSSVFGSGDVPWLADYAARGGLRYEPDVDERWLRVWEPYATLKTPVRYEHALHLSAPQGSLTIARFVLPAIHAQVPGAPEPKGPEALIVVAQDERLTGGRACAVSVVARRVWRRWSAKARLEQARRIGRRAHAVWCR